ncbi:MAG: bifunctional UDP-N-acetylglucosamine diphosphorylase/glucosamine-1-phosphate N-acetyltransferase GlmU [Holosporales bacterium]|jgi:bifunctional UDP-N-acetylglucosamine pyrophosphorylase/glucosamine-1-phosphate N-acetyltransferase|nr:bifunctional UDP-N-acetylglucosamine diphosphorylase/glucosamine-1-phosphate N-acetyltransferase GlmU [Holosporales bacterium]
MEYTSAIILAGGEGRRMRSSTPKVLHSIGGASLLEWIVQSLHQAQGQPAGNEIIVVGSKLLFAHEMWPTVSKNLAGLAGNVRFIEQAEPRGTGHAVQVALQCVDERAQNILICNGDVPFVRKETFLQLLTQRQHQSPHSSQHYQQQNGICLLAMRINTPEQATYGRIILHQNSPVDIVEAADASDEQKKINLVNVGVYCFSKKCLTDVIFRLDNKNRAGEFYLTDAVRLAHESGFCNSYIEIPAEEGAGIDTIDALIHSRFMEMLVARAIAAGATFQDPKSAVLSYDTKVGPGCTIGAFNVFGKNVVLEGGVMVLPFCYLEDCIIKRGSTIGPFARIKGGSVVGEDTTIGNFVEVKKAAIGNCTKIKHLAYIGDATIGNAVNIGAGTIFCNFDGVKKHATIVGDNAKVGANVSLVAPLTIGEAAFIGAGSVITKDIPKETLAVARAGQVHNAQWLAKKLSKK